MTARERSRETMAATTEPKTKPVRVDLVPAVHKALRRKAADCEMSMAALARKIIAEHLGFTDETRGS